MNEGDQFCKCNRCLKMVILAHLYVGFFTIVLIKHALLKRFYLSLKLLQSRTTFKQKGNYEVSSHSNFCMEFFTAPNAKNIIATLRIVTIEKSELIFLLIFYVHVEMFLYKHTERIECISKVG